MKWRQCNHSVFTYIKPSSGSIKINCFAQQSHYQSGRRHRICLTGCFCMTVPNRTQFSFNLGTSRKQTAFSPWCMFLLLHAPCGDSIKQVSISNRRHSLKSFQLVQLSETMNLLLTSAFLFGMGLESGD